MFLIEAFLIDHTECNYTLILIHTMKLYKKGPLQTLAGLLPLKYVSYVLYQKFTLLEARLDTYY